MPQISRLDPQQVIPPTKSHHHHIINGAHLQFLKPLVIFLLVFSTRRKISNNNNLNKISFFRLERQEMPWRVLVIRQKLYLQQINTNSKISFNNEVLQRTIVIPLER